MLRMSRAPACMASPAKKSRAPSNSCANRKTPRYRLGHGIGLDGHEHPYLVRGSKTILEPGMTFSNEPGIYIPGEFGLRCEDDMVIAADGPAQLLTPGFAPSLEKPFA